MMQCWAEMAELVDAVDSKSTDFGRAGSSPALGTTPLQQSGLVAANGKRPVWVVRSA